MCEVSKSSLFPVLLRGAYLKYCFRALVIVFTSQSMEFSRSNSLHVFTSSKQARKKTQLKSRTLKGPLDWLTKAAIYVTTNNEFCGFL